MKKLLCIFLFLLNFTIQSSFAQNLTQTIKGSVIDADTKEPLIGASVLVLETNPPIGNVTDENGNFKITGVPVGRQSLKVSFIGYEDFLVSNIIVSSAKEVVLNLELKESLNTLKEVVMVAEQEKDRPLNDMATVGARTFSVEETSRYAASFADPARMAQSFAGVSSGGSDGNDIVVRGNSPIGLLWRLEGIEIPNPNHFSNGEGSSGGAISTISNTVLANSDFMTGAFPAEYGNASSGVFDLRFRNGNAEKREYSVQVGALGVQLAAEGGFKKGKEASYLVNYRYSTTGVLDAIGINLGGNVTPTFQDVNFKINLPTQKLGKFAIFGLGGISYGGEKAIRDTTQWKSRWDSYEGGDLQHRGVVGLSHRYNFGNQKTYLKNIVAVTYEGKLDVTDTLNKRYEATEIYRVRNSYTNMRWSSTLNHKFNARHVLRTGFIFSNLGYNTFRKEMNFETNQINETLNEKSATQLLQGFAQWQYRANEKLTFNVGGHYTRLLLNGSQSLEPRVGAQFQLNNNHTFSFGAGMHTRVAPVAYYLTKVTMPDGSLQDANRNIGLTKAVHQAISHDWRISDNWRLKTEAYYQYLYDVPVEINGTESILNTAGGIEDIRLNNAGKGENYGLEFTLERFLSKGFYALITASLYESRYQDGLGTWRNSRFNNHYVFNVLGGKEFKVGREKQNALTVNTRIMWRGGLYETPIDLAKSKEEQRTVTIKEQAYTYQVPDFFRVDFSCGYRINRPKTSWSINAEIQNITNRLNFFGQYFDTKTQEIKVYNYVGLLPNLNIRVDF
jgi:CarboxypepD_reg-like domain